MVPLEDRGAEAVPAPVRPDYELGVSPKYRPRAREVKDRELPIRAREVDVRRVVGPLFGEEQKVLVKGVKASR